MRVRLEAALAALGPPGVIAIGIFLSAAAFYFLGVLPAERAAAEKQRLAAHKPVRLVPVQRVSENPQIERFYALFPPAERLTDQLERVHRFAATAGVQVMKGDYRLEGKEGALDALHISLPVRGSYAEIRRFVALVLKEMPVASLDALRFERRKVGEPQLDAQIQLTVYFRPAEAQ
jgi:hypothetical protein